MIVSWYEPLRHAGSSSNSGSGSTFSASPPPGRSACPVPHYLTGQGCQPAHVPGQPKGPDPRAVCIPAWKPQHLPISPPKQPVARDRKGGRGRQPPRDWAPWHSNCQRGRTDQAPRQKAPGGCLAVGTRQAVQCGSYGERPRCECRYCQRCGSQSAFRHKITWFSGITADNLPILDHICAKFGQRRLDFQLRIAPLYSLKWDNMVREVRIKVATYNRLVDMEVGACNARRAKAWYVQDR